MKKWISIILVVALSLSLSVMTFAANDKDQILGENEINEQKYFCDATLEDDFADDCVIVVINKSNSKINKKHDKMKFNNVGAVEIEDLTTINEDVDVFAEDSLVNVSDFRQILKITLKKPGKNEVLKAIKKLEKRPEVESAEPSYYIEVSDIDVQSYEAVASIENPMPEATANDPSYSSQYALTKIKASTAWDITKGSRSIKVGVIDTGIASHTDLNANLVSGWDYYNGNGVTNDVTEFPHGTHVAGIIGAVGNNGIGIAGINWNVSLVPLQTVITSGSDRGKLSGSAIISSINYCTNNNIPIVNCSFGSYTSSNSYDVAIGNYKGLVVCAAGNVGADTDIAANRHYPSGSSQPNVMSVAASDENDNFAVFRKSNGEVTGYSNFGATTVDLLAPGNNIISTVPGSYSEYDGTSMAAPYVSGVAALIKSVRPDLTAIQIKYCIMAGVDKLNALSGQCVTGGRLNAKKALDIAIDMPKDRILSGDFNGDGKDDILRAYHSGLDSNGHEQMQFTVSLGGTSSTTLWYTNDWYPFEGAYERIAAGDFNGDGKDDIAIMYYYGSGSIKIHTFLSNGSSFNSGRTWYQDPSYYAEAIDTRFVAGDVNGDGKDDLIAMCEDNSSQVRIHVWKSTGSSFSNVEMWYKSTSFNTSKVGNRFVAGDFDGDGKDDVAVMYDFGSSYMGLYVFPSTGSSFDRVMWHSDNEYDATKVGTRLAAGDFNGDGRCDLTAMYDYGNSRIKVHVFVSTVSGFPRWQEWYTAMTYGDYSANAVDGFVAGDFNGDSKCDLISKYIYPYTPKLHLFTSQTTTFSGWSNWRVFY